MVSRTSACDPFEQGGSLWQCCLSCFWMLFFLQHGLKLSVCSTNLNTSYSSLPFFPSFIPGRGLWWSSHQTWLQLRFLDRCGDWHGPNSKVNGLVRILEALESRACTSSPAQQLHCSTSKLRTSKEPCLNFCTTFVFFQWNIFRLESCSATYVRSIIPKAAAGRIAEIFFHLRKYYRNEMWGTLEP